MHRSLRPATNLLLIAVTASIVMAALLLSSPSAMLPLIGAGALFGIVVGSLQLRGISQAEDPLLAADSAPAVRSALMSSKAGRASIYGLWVSAFLLVVVMKLVGKTAPMGIVAGFAALVLFRDLVALKGCYMLQRRWERKYAELS